MSQTDDAPYSARLRIRPTDDSAAPIYEVLLDGRPLQQLLAADGLRIHFDEQEDPPQPVVEMKFAPGALYLDLDAKMVADILRSQEVTGS